MGLKELPHTIAALRNIEEAWNAGQHSFERFSALTKQVYLKDQACGHKNVIRPFFHLGRLESPLIAPFQLSIDGALPNALACNRRNCVLFISPGLSLPGLRTKVEEHAQQGRNSIILQIRSQASMVPGRLRKDGVLI